MNGYFFVPGQRFRELYYWDTYWVAKGLLVSGMHQSAKVGWMTLLHAVISLLMPSHRIATSWMLFSQPAPEATPHDCHSDLSEQVVVGNLIRLLNTHGFVPNGSRSYYLNRRCTGRLTDPAQRQCCWYCSALCFRSRCCCILGPTHNCLEQPREVTQENKRWVPTTAIAYMS